MTAPSSESLVPLGCPFCGEKASADGVARFNQTHEAWFADGTRILEAFFVNCMSCGANNQGIAGGHQTREKAIEAWNRRTSAPSGKAGDVSELAQRQSWLLMLAQIRDEWRQSAEDDPNDNHDWQAAADEAEALRAALPSLLNANAELAALTRDYGLLLDSSNVFEIERNKLRESHARAVKAVEALPRYRPGDEREANMVMSPTSGVWLSRYAVLKALSEVQS